MEFLKTETNTKRLLKMFKGRTHKFLHSERKTQLEKYKHYVINMTQVVEDTKSIYLGHLEALSYISGKTE